MPSQVLQTPKSVKRVHAFAADATQTDGDSQRKTVSVEEAARILGISRGAAYAYANDGSIPTIRLGRRLLVPKAGLNRLLMTTDTRS
jgi:excisionase family DNA binding protein